MSHTNFFLNIQQISTESHSASPQILPETDISPLKTMPTVVLDKKNRLIQALKENLKRRRQQQKNKKN